MSEDTIQVPIDVRFRDVDVMGHVNNAVYATYLEEARVTYYDEVTDLRLEEIDTAIAHLSMDFHGPVEMRQQVVVEPRVDSLGESSITMEYHVSADGETIATGETVEVLFDPDTGSSVPLPEDWRERIRAFEGL